MSNQAITVTASLTNAYRDQFFHRLRDIRDTVERLRDIEDLGHPRVNAMVVRSRSRDLRTDIANAREARQGYYRERIRLC